MNYFFQICCIVLAVGSLCAENIQLEVSGWKVGAAKLSITPKKSIWLSGYASREAPSQGKLHNIWAKALALEDQTGHRAVLVTVDISGIPKDISTEIRRRLKVELDLDKDQIILNSSHTHSGPLLEKENLFVYPLTDRQHKRINKYSTRFINQIVRVVKKSLKSIEPAHMFSGNGVARFQVNRRNNNESTLVGQPQLQGPVDHAVPVIKVTNSQNKVIAIAFGYACHPTVLNINQISGDYPGFAQIELEKDYPDAVALFFQGAGGNQNPLPRRTIPLARQYGRALAAAVDRMMQEDMKEVQPTLSTSYEEIDLDLNPPPGQDDLIEHCEIASGYIKWWGQHQLAKIERDEGLREKYPYPIQVWALGEQSIFTFGGELVVEYALQIKQIFGFDAFVMGYSNDVMSYIPTARILHERGYEGATSQFSAGMPNTWAFNIENKILSTAVRMAKDIGIKPQTSRLIDN